MPSYIMSPWPKVEIPLYCRICKETIIVTVCDEHMADDLMYRNRAGELLGKHRVCCKKCFKRHQWGMGELVNGLYLIYMINSTVSIAAMRGNPEEQSIREW